MKDLVLVTGSTGYLGSRLVRNLAMGGLEVRALARLSSDISNLQSLPVEIVFGDICDEESLKKAFAGVTCVIHAAAETRTDSSTGGQPNATIEGTRNILELCRVFNVQKLIYISSCSVYETVGLESGDVINEKSMLERRPEERGAYSASKLEAEKIVVPQIGKGNCNITVLRPGIIWDESADVLSRTVGIVLFRRFLFVFGMGDFLMPLVHVDNLVHCIDKLLKLPQGGGGIYNVVDQTVMTKKVFIGYLIRKKHPGIKIVHIPLVIWYFATAFLQCLSGVLNKKALLTTYRLRSSQNNVAYNSTALSELIGDFDLVSLEDVIEKNNY